MIYTLKVNLIIPTLITFVLKLIKILNCTLRWVGGLRQLLNAFVA